MSPLTNCAVPLNTIPLLPQFHVQGIAPGWIGPEKLQLTPMLPEADALAIPAGNESWAFTAPLREMPPLKAPLVALVHRSRVPVTAPLALSVTLAKRPAVMLNGRLTARPGKGISPVDMLAVADPVTVLLSTVVCVVSQQCCVSVVSIETFSPRSGAPSPKRVRRKVRTGPMT